MMFPPRKPDDHDRPVLEFTPQPGTKIEQLAPLVVKTMERLDMDAEIHFPAFTLEVPRGSTPEDIVEAYKQVVVDYLPEVRKPRPPYKGPKLF